jgi:ETFB lysine methyltransferase
VSLLRYRYQTREFGLHDIHFRSLRDRQQFEDVDGEAEALGISSAAWPMFGVVWQSGEVLAQLMTQYDIKGRRILEVGCGVALASLVLNNRKADISATDIHPCAESYLQFNTRLNQGRAIPFLRTAWEDQPVEGFGLFDLIIGSDVLFERQHTQQLSQFIEKYAKPCCEVIVIEGGRGYAGNFTRCMKALGYSQQQLHGIKPFSDPRSYRGQIQRYYRKLPLGSSAAINPAH